MIVRRIARPMLASIFVAGGVDALRNPSGRAKAAKPLIDKSQDVLPDEVTQNVPDDPETLVKINAAIQIGGGVLLATGKAPRIASAVLAGSLVPTTLAGHAFWEETDPEAKALQRTQFLKNVSLLGGLLIAAVDTEGKPSVAWRSKRAARNAKVAVAGAIPLASSSDTSDTLASAGHKAKEFAEVAAERVQPYAEVAAHKGAEQAAVLANVAQDRGGKLAELAKERSAKWADLAAARASDLAEVAQDKGSKYADVAVARGADLAERARKDGSDLLDEYGKKARKATKKQRKEARKQLEQARKDYKKKYASASKDAQKQLQSSLKDAEKRARSARAQIESTVHQYV
ncbi:Uncharacterized membrane protein YphA, DoxX/SURF4 family [Rhodococcoides kroppenstedtii]|uniref:Uncharacterized membrane protein YphA, DoxX/SURF4 family n=1 Tax=Rhodococcoides kroppenstedtii TaxID=293050 RepID=A0A1I0UCD9_9NOCA|nr:Uncharacterized membrane protein YphA, DoxX/SURF4 family [Rhodococcus kroppenstedtii]